MMAIGGEAVRTVGDRVKVTVEWDEAWRTVTLRLRVVAERLRSLCESRQCIRGGMRGGNHARGMSLW